MFVEEEREKENKEKERKRERKRLGISREREKSDKASVKSASQSVSQGFICEIINKRANTCDPTIEEYVYSSRSSMIWCLGLVWSACAYRVPCLPKLVLF